MKHLIKTKNYHPSVDDYYDAVCRFRAYYGESPEVVFMTKETLEELVKEIKHNYQLNVSLEKAKFLGMKIILTRDFHGIGYKIEKLNIKEKKKDVI